MKRGTEHICISYETHRHDGQPESSGPKAGVDVQQSHQHEWQREQTKVIAQDQPMARDSDGEVLNGLCGAPGRGMKHHKVCNDKRSRGKDPDDAPESRRK